MDITPEPALVDRSSLVPVGAAIAGARGGSKVHVVQFDVVRASANADALVEAQTAHIGHMGRNCRCLHADYRRNGYGVCTAKCNSCGWLLVATRRAHASLHPANQRHETFHDDWNVREEHSIELEQRQCVCSWQVKVP